MWDEQEGCILPCLKSEYNTGVRLEDGTCECNEKGRWDQEDKECKGIDCKSIRYTDGQEGNADDGCTCVSGYEWDSESLKCVVTSCQ